jgi:putative sugar O-methyltransferase
MQKTSISDNFYYPSIVSEAILNDNVFNIFKSHPSYTPILEHVSYEDGLSYLSIIENEYNFLLNNFEKYKTNDIIGTPKKHEYKYGKMSPTTLRYIKVMGDLVNYFGNLDGLDVVEIGCGYGGQCKIILDTYNVKSYTLIDLPNVLELTKKYLLSLNIDISNIFFKDISQLTDNENYDLFISNYAYTECIDEIREIYANKILYKSKMGYVTANMLPLEILDKEIINKIEKSFKIKEIPYTGDGNIIIIWK